MKSIKGKKDNAKFNDKFSEFKSHADKTLFDISSCKCRSFSVCSCARNRKIPERKDQRTSKEMVIEEIDAAVSKKIAILEERKSRFELFQIKQQKSQNDEFLDSETYMISTSESSIDHESDATEDPGYLETRLSHMKRKVNFKSRPAKRINFARFSSVCDRTSVSDRAATIIASSVLHDNAGCSKTNPALVIDRSKVRKSRNIVVFKKRAKKQMITKILLFCTLMVRKIRQ